MTAAGALAAARGCRGHAPPFPRCRARRTDADWMRSHSASAGSQSATGRCQTIPESLQMLWDCCHIEPPVCCWPPTGSGGAESPADRLDARPTGQAAERGSGADDGRQLRRAARGAAERRRSGLLARGAPWRPARVAAAASRSRSRSRCRQDRRIPDRSRIRCRSRTRRLRIRRAPSFARRHLQGFPWCPPFALVLPAYGQLAPRPDLTVRPESDTYRR